MIRIVAQLALDGLAIGLIYALLASGFSMIMAISGILFIAYGEFYMLGAYILWGLTVPLKLPFFPSLCITVAVTGLLGGLVYLLVFERMQSRRLFFLVSILAAIGIAMAMKQSALLMFGTESRGMPSLFNKIIEFWGLTLTMEKAVLIMLSVATVVALHLFLRRTDTGRAMRAVSFNVQAAQLQGVNPRRVYLLTTMIGCGLAGFSGGVMAPVYALSPEMGMITLMILLVVMFAGIGSMLGAIVAGLIVGVVSSFGQYFIGTGVAQILLFATIAIVLFFRPGGLFAEVREEMF
jgi:branched-chain amino acid transport system permease protein